MTPLKQKISPIPFSIGKGDNSLYLAANRGNVDCCNVFDMTVSPESIRFY